MNLNKFLLISIASITGLCFVYLVVFAQEMGNPLHKIRNLYLETQETLFSK